MVSSTKLQIRGCIFVCTHPHCIDWSAVKLVEFILEFSLQLLFELLEAVFAGKTILRDLENLQSGIGQCAPSLGTAIPTPLPWRRRNSPARKPTKQQNYNGKKNSLNLQPNMGAITVSQSCELRGHKHPTSSAGLPCWMLHKAGTVPQIHSPGISSFLTSN